MKVYVNSSIYLVYVNSSVILFIAYKVIYIETNVII